MKGRRWNSEEDQLLRERVLDCITNGGTQLQAFEEVGKKVGRTSGACGFRWNAVLRQKDPLSYTDAKKKRVYKELQKRKGFQLDSMAQVVFSLKRIGKQCRTLREDVQALQNKIHQKNSYYNQLLDEHQKLSKESSSFEWYQKEVKEKYEDLIHFLEIAKRDSVSADKIELLNSVLAEISVDTNSTSSS